MNLLRTRLSSEMEKMDQVAAEFQQYLVSEQRARGKAEAMARSKPAARGPKHLSGRLGSAPAAGGAVPGSAGEGPGQKHSGNKPKGARWAAGSASDACITDQGTVTRKSSGYPRADSSRVGAPRGSSQRGGWYGDVV